MIPAIKSRTHSNSRGITLLEVLISMFVALVGLAGLAALFWLGGVEMSEGAKADRSMAVARAAQRSFKILGMHRPIQSCTTTIGATTVTTQVQTWMTPAGATVDGSGTTSGGSPTTTPPVNMPFSTTSFGSLSAPNIAYGYYTQGFAIDPIGVIANQSGATNSAPTFPAFDSTGHQATFPSPSTASSCLPSTTDPCLSRITLQAYPQNSTGSAYPQTTISSYSTGQADLVFRSQDDLLFNPPNGDYPPTQFYSAAGRRQSQGDYSWLATVVPGFDTYQVNTATTPATYTALGDTNLVRVSIVVFFKRIPLVTLDSTGLTAPSERMVTVHNPPISVDGNSIAPTGVAGGDVQLSTTQSQSYLNVKAGQWIMLSQAPTTTQFNSQATTPPPNVTMLTTYWYRWYKIVATGPIQGPAAGSYYRNVTLSGPDWDPNPTGSATPITTFASIFDGVVTVFEQELELEQSGSTFSPN